MELHKPFTIFVIAIGVIYIDAAINNIDVRKPSLHIPEKIIGGVIDIVQNHKHKPTQQQFQGSYQQTQGSYQQNQGNYQHNQGYQPQAQYPQQWIPPPNYQYPPPQYQQQFQGQYNNYQQGSGQIQAQGQYTGYPQGPNQTSGQHSQGSGPGYPNKPNQTTGQYNQGQFQVQGQHQVGSNPHGQTGSGPTCVCQAWSKPQQILSDEGTTLPSVDEHTRATLESSAASGSEDKGTKKK